LAQWIQNRWVADPDNGYLILDKAGPAGQCLGFAQTGLFDGYFVVEIRIDKNDSDFGFWKAGTKELVHGIVSEAKDGRFQTFTNEALKKKRSKRSSSISMNTSSYIPISSGDRSREI
jgi:hypothetical protein